MCCSTLKIGKIFILGFFFASIGKKTYFLALGTIPKKGVALIARKITEFILNYVYFAATYTRNNQKQSSYIWQHHCYVVMMSQYINFCNSITDNYLTE